MSPVFQPLEARQLLSAVVADGVLTVTGTAKNDRIVVSLSSDGETLTVSEASGNRFRKKATTTTEFAAADVSSVVVNAGAGNDSVTLKGTRKTPFSIGATINGDAGNDNLIGGAGADSINGGEGDDNLYGNAGTDLLSGGAGDDLLVGGADIDTLNGEDGDDLIKSAGDSVIDIIDGGADSAATGEDDEDSAIVDDDETATNAYVVEPEDLWHGPFFGGVGFGPGMGGHKGHGPKGGSSSGSNSGSSL